MPTKERNKQKLIYFSPEEWRIVGERAAAVHMKPGTFIQTIAVQGEIKSYDMAALNNLRMSFNRIGVELNQIARVANSTQSVYQKDIEDMQKQMEYFRKVMDNYLVELKPTILL